MSIATVLLAVLVVLILFLTLTRRFQFPLLTDIGMGMVALGTVGAIDSLANGNWACSDTAIALRWGFVGGGLLLMLVSITLRLWKRQGRRLADLVVIDPDDMRHVPGGKHEGRIPPL